MIAVFAAALMRVLIVKVSSLGDIIHTLPAVTDAHRSRKGIRFDWVVEEGFTEVPSWHPAVEKVIPVAFRRWRKNLLGTWRSGEFQAFRENLRERHYDLVIDAQGLIKSGIISRISRGLTVGLSNHTIREPHATLFYNMKYVVPWQQHAVVRVRDLFARSLNYNFEPHACDYGLDMSLFGNPAQERALVFFHGTTWESKKWPLRYWQKLAIMAGEQGYTVYLPWGDEEELERAQAIARLAPAAVVLERMNLTGIASLLARTQGVVAVDTGLAHLATALNIPVVSIFGASNPDLTGTYGYRQLHLSSTIECAPCLNKHCRYRGEPRRDEFMGENFIVEPACYADNPPERVWDRLQILIAGGKGSLDSLFYPKS